MMIGCFQLSERKGLLKKNSKLKVVPKKKFARGGAEDECNNNDNLRVQWDLTGFYPIVFDVRHVMQ